MALVLDTSVLVAALYRGDADHARCAALVRDSPEDLVVPETTLAEVDYWLQKWVGVAAWSRLFDEIRSGIYRIGRSEESDFERAVELEVQYDDLSLGFVDASVVALCERLGETKVATLDHRHFSVVQPRHCERLELLPV